MDMYTPTPSGDDGSNNDDMVPADEAPSHKCQRPDPVLSQQQFTSPPTPEPAAVRHYSVTFSALCTLDAISPANQHKSHRFVRVYYIDPVLEVGANCRCPRSWREAHPTLSDSAFVMARVYMLNGGMVVRKLLAMALLLPPVTVSFAATPPKGWYSHDACQPKQNPNMAPNMLWIQVKLCISCSTPIAVSPSVATSLVSTGRVPVGFKTIDIHNDCTCPVNIARLCDCANGPTLPLLAYQAGEGTTTPVVHGWPTATSPATGAPWRPLTTPVPARVAKMLDTLRATSDNLHMCERDWEIARTVLAGVCDMDGKLQMVPSAVAQRMISAGLADAAASQIATAATLSTSMDVDSPMTRLDKMLAPTPAPPASVSGIDAGLNDTPRAAISQFVVKGTPPIEPPPMVKDWAFSTWPIVIVIPFLMHLMPRMERRTIDILARFLSTNVDTLSDFCNVSDEQQLQGDLQKAGLKHYTAIGVAQQFRAWARGEAPEFFIPPTADDARSSESDVM